MFESLSDRLEGAFKSLKGQSRITELNIATTIKEIRRALVDADVNYKIAKELTDKIRDEAIGQKVLNSVSPSQQMTKIVSDQLTQLMGSEKVDINLKGSPCVILMSGLQGSGKTTFAAKLANYLKTKVNRTVMMAACDVYRPAAIEQLKILGSQIDVPVYEEPDNKNPVSISQHALEEARLKQFSTLIIDTAGRLAVDEEMMNEIAALKKAVQPSEILFVVDSMTGQDAVNTAAAFNERLNFDGVVLTKLDGDTRGGAALSIKYTVHKPIKFVSTGEKLDQVDVFYPDRMAQRILGMGDIVTLVEKAQEQYDAKQAGILEKKIRKNQFDFNDFLSQLSQIKKMGNVKDLLGMIPGVGKAVKDVDLNNDSFKKIEAVILSMTPKERANPELLNGTRKKRISEGSGNSIQEVNKFLKQFEDMRKMMKTASKMNTAGRAMKNPFGR
jgi:signal recognition particle subunit SRP54